MNKRSKKNASNAFQQETILHIPRSVQASIPIKKIYHDGIWEVASNGIFLQREYRFSKTWLFSDINYQVTDYDERSELFSRLAAIYNALPTDNTHTKISIINKKQNLQNFKAMLLPEQKDGLDKYRAEYNKMLLDKSAAGNNIIREKYITVSCERKAIEEARRTFARIGSDLTANFAQMGSIVQSLDIQERLRIFHDFFRSNDDDHFRFDLEEYAHRGHDFRDTICPDAIKFYSDHFELGDDKYGRVLFLKDYGATIKDGMIAELAEMNKNLILSIDILPLATDEAMKIAQRKIMAVETDITRWQMRQNENNNFTAVIPYDKEQMRRETKEFMTDLTSRDQRMMYVVLTIVHLADSMEELDNDTETLKSTAAKRGCQLATLTFQQEDGLNTALPYGIRPIDTVRTLNTAATAALMPFASQEIQHSGGIYYGLNATSNNMIICDRRTLLNANGFILGVSGSGKSFAAKEEIASLILSTQDDVLIIDPENEFSPLVHALGGEVIHVDVRSKNYINAMDIGKADRSTGDDEYDEDGDGEEKEERNDRDSIFTNDTQKERIASKSEFIMSLCEQIITNRTLGGKEQSLIDRCVREVYEDYFSGKTSDNDFASQTNDMPTLKDFRLKLLAQNEPLAHEIALELEIYTEGSLNIFAHQTNVDLSNRLIAFDILELGSQLKTVGMLIVLDAIMNRVSANHQQGKRTWIVIDEIYLLFANAYSSRFLEESWKRFRKKGAAATGVTQNISDCLKSPSARNMLSNSEFLILLNQSPADRIDLAELLRIGDEELQYISNVGTGQGLIKVGSAMIPFKNDFPRNTELYDLMTTKPGESLIGGRDQT